MMKFILIHHYAQPMLHVLAVIRVSCRCAAAARGGCGGCRGGRGGDARIAVGFDAGDEVEGGCSKGWGFWGVGVD